MKTFFYINIFCTNERFKKKLSSEIKMNILYKVSECKLTENSGDALYLCS